MLSPYRPPKSASCARCCPNCPPSDLPHVILEKVPGDWRGLLRADAAQCADLSEQGRSAQQPEARQGQRRSRDEEHAPGVEHEEGRTVRYGGGTDVRELGSRIPRQVRLSGQLLRVLDLGRE